MTTEIEKKFFDAFGIECNRHHHQQFNGCQVQRGLEFFKERQKLVEKGFIKIWHKMLTPRPENDCVYWGEYHYPIITDRILLELIVINNENAPAVGDTLEELRNQVLYWCIRYKNKIYTQVRALFGVREEKQ